jgi:hypothetical protein
MYPGGGEAAAYCACPTSVVAFSGQTFNGTRTGASTCSKKGISLTGIENDDLVVCGANNEIRIGAPADGGWGVMQDPAATNTTVRSEELDNAAWADTVSTSPDFDPSFVSGTYTSPLTGSATADLYIFGGAGWAAAAEHSLRSQAAGCPIGASTFSIYAKSVSGGTTLDLGIQTLASSTWATCTINTSTWTRCRVGASAGSSRNIYVGVGQLTASTTRTPTEVLLFGAQCESDAVSSGYPTAYIPTAGSSVARNAETLVSAANVFAAGAGCVGYSISAYRQWQNGMVGSDGTSHGILAVSTNSVLLYVQNSLVATFGGSIVPGAGTPYRWVGRWGAGGSSVGANGAQVDAGAASVSTARPMRIGAAFSTTPMQGSAIFSSIQYDDSSGACE